MLYQEKFSLVKMKYQEKSSKIVTKQRDSLLSLSKLPVISANVPKKHLLNQNKFQSQLISRDFGIHLQTKANNKDCLLKIPEIPFWGIDLIKDQNKIKKCIKYKSFLGLHFWWQKFLTHWQSCLSSGIQPSQDILRWLFFVKVSILPHLASNNKLGHDAALELHNSA